MSELATLARLSVIQYLVESYLTFLFHANDWFGRTCMKSMGKYHQLDCP